MRESRRQSVLDTRAALVAGGVAGAVFLTLLLVWMPRVLGGNAGGMVRYLASLVMGDSVLPPPSTVEPVVVATGIGVHLALAIGFSFLIALVIHRWGLVVGLLGGAGLGAALYAINVFAVTAVFPWWFVMNGWPFFLIHVIFGATAGGVYELLDTDVAEVA